MFLKDAGTTGPAAGPLFGEGSLKYSLKSELQVSCGLVMNNKVV